MDEEYRPKTTVYFQGIDVLDLVGFIGRLTKRYQANLLTEIEDVVDPSSDEYSQIRKLVLDSTNNFSRSVVKVIFGDVEY